MFVACWMLSLSSMLCSLRCFVHLQLLTLGCCFVKKFLSPLSPPWSLGFEEERPSVRSFVSSDSKLTRSQIQRINMQTKHTHTYIYTLIPGTLAVELTMKQVTMCKNVHTIA